MNEGSAWLFGVRRQIAIWQEEFPLLRLPAHLFRALGRRDRSPMGLVRHDRLSDSKGQAIFHVASHEVAFNPVTATRRHGLYSPQEHWVLSGQEALKCQSFAAEAKALPRNQSRCALALKHFRSAT